MAVFHTDEQGNRRWRKAPKECPRGINDGPDLQCSGGSYKGVRLTGPHTAPFTEFGHHGEYCARGSARCRNSRCRACLRAVDAARLAANKDRWAGWTDEDIRATKPEKRCPSCDTSKPSEEFSIGRVNLDGLNTRCRLCKSEGNARTVTPEAWRRGKHTRRARKKYSPDRSRYTLPERDFIALLAHHGIEVSVCYFAGCAAEAAHWDHVKPLADGGEHAPWNLLPACAFHNTSKNARPLKDVSEETYATVRAQLFAVAKDIGFSWGNDRLDGWR